MCFPAPPSVGSLGKQLGLIGSCGSTWDARVLGLGLLLTGFVARMLTERRSHGNAPDSLGVQEEFVITSRPTHRKYICVTMTRIKLAGCTDSCPCRLDALRRFTSMCIIYVERIPVGSPMYNACRGMLVAGLIGVDRKRFWMLQLRCASACACERRSNWRSITAFVHHMDARNNSWGASYCVAEPGVHERHPCFIHVRCVSECAPSVCREMYEVAMLYLV